MSQLHVYDSNLPDNINGTRSYFRITTGDRHACREGAVDAEDDALGLRWNNGHEKVDGSVIASHDHLQRDEILRSLRHPHETTLLLYLYGIQPVTQRLVVGERVRNSPGFVGDLGCHVYPLSARDILHYVNVHLFSR